jgi:phosphoglycerate dehydrogenase-like enzyme
MKIAVLDDYQGVARDWASWSDLGPDAEVVSFDRHLRDIDEAQRLLADFDVICIIRERMAMPRQLLEQLDRLKLLVFTGRGSEVIDYAAAAARGVVVCHTSGDGGSFGPSSVVEHTWALILNCMRNFSEENRNIRTGSWRANVSHLLDGKTLGILGLGRIGTDVARIGKAFGMTVVAWSPNMTAERAEAGGAVAVGEEAFFRESDVISIHMRLSDRSRGLVGARQIGWMKPSAALVNTARGPIVDEDALVAALRSKRIRAAGLDVFDKEPLPVDHPSPGWTTSR